MDDFTAKPGVPNNYGLIQGVANAIQPGKRMLSSMTPTIVLDPDEELFLVTGSPGGSKIISTVFQTISNAIDYRLDLSSVVRAPRVHHQHLPDQIVFEYSGLSYNTFERLDRLGHRLAVVTGIGEVQAIMRMPNGTLEGMPDPRGNGVAAGSFR
jgi:gamma-glutamyltranspeptidase/glutathione hydrolase